MATLIEGLVTRIEVRAGWLREDQERHGFVAPETVADAGDWLLEYRNLLAALGARRRFARAGATMSVTASMPAADELVRACARQSVQRVLERLHERSGDRDALRLAAVTAGAWVRTLVDLRELDEAGPDWILD